MGILTYYNMPDNKERKIIIPLKKSVLTFDNKPIPDPDALSESERAEIKTQQDMIDKAPPLTVGSMLSLMFSTSLPPKTNKDAETNQRFARKIFNKMQTAKGEWFTDVEEVNKLIETLEPLQGGMKSAKFVGELLIILKDILFVDQKQAFNEEEAKKE